MIALVLTALLRAPLAQESKPVAPIVSAPSGSIEEEVLANVKSQPLGPGTVDDLALPDEFLRRVGDRIIRTSFEERYRLVLSDAALATPDAKPDVKPGASGTAASSHALIVLLVATAALIAVFVFAVLAMRSRSRSAT